MSESAGYNGWTNYETWCVNLWLSNDEALYNDVQDVVLHGHDLSNVYAASLSLKNYVEELPEASEVLSGASFVSDLLGAALSEVNWQEIAESWLRDMDDENDDEDDEEDEA